MEQHHRGTSGNIRQFHFFFLTLTVVPQTFLASIKSVSEFSQNFISSKFTRNFVEIYLKVLQNFPTFPGNIKIF